MEAALMTSGPATATAGRERGPRRDWGRMATAACIAVYVVLGVAAFWGAWGADPTHVTLYGPDQVDSMWFLGWVPFALGHGHNPLLTDFANYPFGVNVLVNTSTPLLGLIISPVTVIWGTVASYNVLCTVALAGSATSGYFFARRWTAWRPAAFVGGLLYGFSPYVMGQALAHLNLTFVVLPPIILLVTHDLAVRREGSVWLRRAVLGVLVTAQFFISPEVLATTAVMAGVMLVLLAVAGHRSVCERLPFLLKGLVTAGAIGIVLLAYPIWLSLRGPGHITGTIENTVIIRADLLGPVVPDTVQWLAPARFAHMGALFAGNILENGSYLGITLLIVLIVGTVLLWRLLVVRLAAIWGLVAFVFSLGARLAVSGLPGVPQLWLYPLPGAIFTRIPVLSQALPSRYSLYQDLAAALLLAIVVDRVWAWASTRRRAVHSAVTALSRWPAVLLSAAVALVALVPIIPVLPVPVLPMWPPPPTSGPPASGASPPTAWPSSSPSPASGCPRRPSGSRRPACASNCPGATSSYRRRPAR